MLSDTGSRTITGTSVQRSDDSMDETKTCTRCKKAKLLSEYYKNPRTPDGLCTQCKSCMKDNSKAYHKTSQAKKLRRTYRQTRAQVAESQARRAVNAAVRSGRLTIPLECEGTDHEGDRVDKLFAHHTSYKRVDWLKVTWLCAKCHNKADAARRSVEPGRQV